MAEQASFVGRPEGRPRPSSTVRPTSWRSAAGEQQVGTQPRVELRQSRGRASRRRPCARAARPRTSGGRRASREARGARAETSSRETRADGRAQPRVVRSRPARNSRKPSSSSASRRIAGRQPRRDRRLRRGLERAHLELEPVAEALDPAEHAHRVAFGEARVEQLDVVPDARLDASARVDELEREIRAPPSCAQALLLRDRVDALDGAVLLELRDRGHGTASLRPAVDTVAAWPRSGLSARSATTSGSPGRSSSSRRPTTSSPGAARGVPGAQPVQRRPPDAARLGGAGGPGPRRLARTTACSSRTRSRRTGGSRRSTSAPTASRARAKASSPRCASSRTRSASSCRTSARTRARRRGGCACCARRARSSSRSSCSTTARRVDGLGEPDLAAEGGVTARLWRLDAEFGDRAHGGDRGRAAADRRRPPPLRDGARLPRGGRHRGERLAAGRDRPDRPGGTDDLPDAPRRAVGQRRQRDADRSRPATSCRASSSTATARTSCSRATGSTPRSSTGSRRRASRTRRTASEAVAAVDRGDAEAAFLLRPTPHRGRVGDRRAAGDVMPQKSTFFYPKLTSGLLFHPLD